MPTPSDNPFRMLPSVEALLRDGALAPLERLVGRERLLHFVQQALERWRDGLQRAEVDAEGLLHRLREGALQADVAERVRREGMSGIRRAVNATGVVLHTGLGRAPVHPEVARAMEEAAGSYCILEIDRFTNKRNRRDDRVGELLRRLTGAEAGIAVNNNAAAVVLLLQTFAAGKETIVSRGELVEIGGSFRMPDVMERAGTKLREVGTTNRTRVEDYRAAVSSATGLLLKVHTSNFRVVGFAEDVGCRELAALGRELGIPSAFDLGSGCIDPDGARPLETVADEPRVREAVASGIDVVTFSGDKLLGGPQAGLIVGRRARIEALRANPLYRALRLDKVGLVGLERTLELLLTGRGDELPTRKMLLARPEELRERAEALHRALSGIDGILAEVIPTEGRPGSGSAPDVLLPGFAVRLRAQGTGAEELAARLREAEPPVFARIQDEAVLLDPRTMLPGDADLVVAAVASCAAPPT